MTGRKSNPLPPASSRAAPQASLYLVATPIGNLEDITLRALRIFREVRWIACEDTRRTTKLLQHYGIAARLVSYHEHNERQRAPELLAALECGESGALVTDAGTPLVSDPGFRLVTACIGRGIPVVPLPGPSAVLVALAGSGLPCNEFLFAGFLPARRAERHRALQRLRDEPRTIVLFEAPHRLAASLADAAEILGSRPAALGRELTKIYEEFRRGTLPELAASVSATPVRGEITLVIGPLAERATLPSASAPASASGMLLSARVNELVQAEGLSRNAALKRAARERGITRREAYRQLLLER
jgi:16S rRNA (cytidine1402-2'-O)-methyltransferase